MGLHHYLIPALYRHGYHGQRLARAIQAGELVLTDEQEESLFRVLQEADQKVTQERNKARRFGYFR